MRHEYEANRYITRYDGSFNGWALRFARQNNLFVKYFPINAYEGSYDKALEAAKSMRTDMLCEMSEPDADIAKIFTKYRTKKLQK